MKKQMMFAASLTALISSTTMAGEVNKALKFNNDADITIHGYVDHIKNEREFRLRDEAGDKIEVDVTSNQSVTLKEGDAVTIVGKIDKDITGIDINASEVTVSKGFVESVNDIAKTIPGVSTTKAQAFNIADLPKNGMVKVSGTVTHVSNEKEFTVQDDTGSIDVDLKSSENAVLTKGARVTVIGNMDNNLLGKDINATEVHVISNAKEKPASK